MTLGQSWELTRGHQKLMLVVVAWFPVLMAVPMLLLGALPYAFPLSSLLATAVTVVEVAALSIAFRRIWQEDSPDSA